MSIFELLSFDIVEFATSIEGILIMVGILFLIIGIVLLCMGKSKNKRKEDKIVDSVDSQDQFDKTEQVPMDSLQQITPVTDSVVAPVAPVAESTVENVNPVTPVESATPIIPVAPVENVPSVSVVPHAEILSDENTASTTAENTTPVGLQESVTAPAVDPINFAEPLNKENTVGESLVASAPVLSVQPASDVENLNKTVQESAVATPSVPVEPSPVVTNPVAGVESIVNEAPVTVYGGANPESAIDKSEFVEKPREIYGGANPLENTAPIPTNTVKEAYSGGLSQQEPVVTPAVESLNTQTPGPAPAVVSTPAPVVDMPTSSPVTPNVVAEPVVPTGDVAPAVTPAPVKEEIETLEF